MQTNYPNCVTVVSHNEGGFSNNPHDPGRATMRGITQATYDAWRLQRGLAKRPVRGIMDAEVAAIYQTYWDGAELPDGLDLMQMDGSINSGKVRGNKWVQRGIGVTPVDGHVGPETIRAASTCDVPKAITASAAARMGFLKALRTWRYFGNGWSARVAYTEAKALAMHAAAAGKPVSAVVGPIVATAQAKVRSHANRAVGAVVAAGGGSAAVHASTLPHWIIPAALGVGAVALIAAARARSHQAARVAALNAVGK